MSCPNHEKCGLHTGVFSPCIGFSGSKSPDLMVVGDIPSAEDDEQNSNFMGEAGYILRETLKSIGFDMDKVAFSHVMKCRTTQHKWGKTINRDPSVKELNTCKNLVMEEIEKLNPRVVLMVGSTTLKALLDMTGITNKRGRVYPVNGREYIPTYAPAMVLRDNSFFEPFAADVRKAYEVLYGDAPTIAPVRYELVDTTRGLIDLLNLAESAEECSFDLETSCLSPYKAGAQIVCCGFSFVERESWVVPLYGRQMIFTGKNLEMAKQVISAIMGSDVPKIAQNGKFDISWLEVTEGIETVNFAYDTMLMQFLLSEMGGTHGLDYLAWQYVPEMGGYDDPLEKYKAEHKEADPKRGGSYRNIPWDIMLPYAGADTDCTLRVKHILEKRLLEPIKP